MNFSPDIMHITIQIKIKDMFQMFRTMLLSDSQIFIQHTFLYSGSSAPPNKPGFL